MSSLAPVVTEFAVLDVVAVACAVYRNQGFVKKGSNYFAFSEPDKQETRPNVYYLYEHFCSGNLYAVEEQDRQSAEAIVDYLKGLSFKAFERKLTDFESNVLKFVSSETVGKDKLGIAASLPNVYAAKLKADRWTEREAGLGSTSEYVGKLNSRCEFSLRVENLRYIAKTESYLVSCSENNANIVKFFAMSNHGITVGGEIKIMGYVKSHAISSYTGFKETMINRIKLIGPVETSVAK
jgi:hypothetical protein